MDYSTFQRYYIDKIYRIIDHFAKFMNSSWKNFKNINIAFLIIFFSNFPSFRRMANLDYGLWKKERKKKTNTLHIFSFWFKVTFKRPQTRVYPSITHYHCKFETQTRQLSRQISSYTRPNYQMFDYITTSPLLRNRSKNGKRPPALYRVSRYSRTVNNFPLFPREFLVREANMINRTHLTLLSPWPPCTRAKNARPPYDKSIRPRGMAKDSVGGYFGQRHARLSIPRYVQRLLYDALSRVHCPSRILTAAAVDPGSGRAFFRPGP